MRGHPKTQFFLKELFFSLLLICFSLMKTDILFSDDFHIRTVDIRVALDIKIVADSVHKEELLLNRQIANLFYEISKEFRDRFGLQFSVKEIKHWKTSPGLKCIEDAFNDLKRKIPREGCEIVAGIISPENMEYPDGGISDYCNGCMLFKHDPEGIKFLALHELCHLFGAVDLDEAGSVMDVERPGFEIDNFTSEVILLNRKRSFQKEAFPLSGDRLNEAAAHFEKRRALGKNEPCVLGFLANLLMEKGDYDKAILRCRKGLEVNPLQRELLSVLAQAYRKTGNPDRAVNEYLKAITLNPKHPDLHYNLGVTYFDMGLLTLSLKEFQKAVELAPRCAVFHYNAGVVFARKGLLDSAIVEFQEAVKLREGYHEAYSNMSAAYLRKGLFEEGMAASNRALGLNPDDAYAYSNLGWAHFQKDEEDEAEKYCLKAIGLDPTLAQPHHVLGVIYTTKGFIDSGLRECKKAVELNTDYTEAHLHLAELYLKIDELSLAAAHFNRVVELSPGNGRAFARLADVSFAQEKYDEAWTYGVEAEKSGVEVESEFKLKVLNGLGMMERAPK